MSKELALKDNADIKKIMGITMDLYLFRHGIAEERSPSLPDSQRALTEKGIQRTTAVAKKLKKLQISFDQIVTSPYLRAKQTADILSDVGLGDRPKVLSALAPMGDFEEGVHYLRDQQQQNPQQTIVFVGHQPDLGAWAETILYDTNFGQIILKKAGIIGIRLASFQLSLPKHQLFLLTSPKWIR